MAASSGQGMVSMAVYDDSQDKDEDNEDVHSSTGLAAAADDQPPIVYDRAIKKANKSASAVTGELFVDAVGNVVNPDVVRLPANKVKVVRLALCGTPRYSFPFFNR